MAAGREPDTAEAILAEYLDHGGKRRRHRQHLHNGHSEKSSATTFAARPGLRERTVLSTKFFATSPGDPKRTAAPAARALISQLEESLRRLRTDYVDSTGCTLDRRAPIEEPCARWDDLVAAGKIRYSLLQRPGLVAAPEPDDRPFRGWALSRRSVRVLVLERTPEVSSCRWPRRSTGRSSVSPLRGGLLSGKYVRDGATPADSLRAGWPHGPTSGTGASSTRRAGPAQIGVTSARSRSPGCAAPAVTSTTLAPGPPAATRQPRLAGDHLTRTARRPDEPSTPSLASPPHHAGPANARSAGRRSTASSSPVWPMLSPAQPLLNPCAALVLAGRRPARRVTARPGTLSGRVLTVGLDGDPARGCPNGR